MLEKIRGQHIDPQTGQPSDPAASDSFDRPDTVERPETDRFEDFEDGEN